MNNTINALKNLKQYESKWGKLGTGSIMDEPDENYIQHSGTNKRGGKRKMSNMEYYAFRKKVLEGKHKNELAHAATISPNELNDQFYNNLFEKNKLIYVEDGKIMNDEICHSGAAVRERVVENTSETSKKSNKKMNYTQSEDVKAYREFKEKAKKATEQYRLSHSTFISPDELNKKSRDEYIKNNMISISHAGTVNYKYYAKENLPGGGVRYYYSRDEWEAAHKNSGSAANQAALEAARRNTAESTNSKPLNKSVKQAVLDGLANKVSENDKANKYVDAAKENPKKAAKDFMNSEEVKKMIDFVEENIKNGSLKVHDRGDDNLTLDPGNEAIENDFKTVLDDLGKIVDQIDANAGTGHKVKKAVSKMLKNKMNKLLKANYDDSSKKKQ